MKFPLLKTLSALLPVLILQAQPMAQEATTAKALSLKQAQEYALLNNASAKNSIIDLELAKKKIWETTAIGLPQLNAQANYQHLFTVPTLSFAGTEISGTEVPFDYSTGLGTTSSVTLLNGEKIYMNNVQGSIIDLGVKNNTTLDITLTQLVFSGEYLVGLQASKVFYLMSDQSRIKTETDLKESVANTYSLVLVLEQSKITLEQSLENLNKTLTEMREMYKQGFIENTDVDQIELTMLNVTNSVNSISRQVKTTMDLMKFQLGMPFENELVLTDSLGSIAGNITMESVMAKNFNVNQNINYQILETQEKLGILSLKREKSTYLPNLAAVYRHSEKVNQPAFDFSPKDVFQLSMNIPIFSSGQRNVKVQQRKLELEKIVNTKENVANGLKLDYNNALNEMASAYENYLNNKKNIELTKRIYEKTLIKYKEGLSSSLDLTNVQNQYLRAQGDYYTAVYTLISTKNKLDKLTNNL
jgi:outer membrane protein